MSKIRDFVLYETNYEKLKNSDIKLAVLPWGATEAHNYHMPYGTDNILGESIATASAELSYNRGDSLIVLPTIPFGVNTGQMDVKLCINMMPSTQLAVLRDIVQVLSMNDIPKLVIVNAHGGNNFKQMIRELSVDFPDVFVCCVDWWKVVPAEEYFNEPGDHAGELETSVVMHLTPDWVLPLEVAGDGKAKKFKMKGFSQGWAYTQRKWTKVTADTGVGDPAKSSAKKGKEFFAESAARLGDFFSELCNTDNDDLYS